jgi:hypothetical protein
LFTDRRARFERRVHRGLKQHENLLPALFPNEVFCVLAEIFFSPRADRQRSFDPPRAFLIVPRASPKQPAMVKTRIACYFDVPRADNRSDYHNFVDVRRGSNDPRAFPLTLRARSETTERRTIGREKTPSAPVRRIAHGSRPNALTPRVPSPHHRSTCARTTPRTL